MRIDELRRELAEMVRAHEVPDGHAGAAIRTGRRRLAIRRVLAASAACVIAATLFAVVGRDDSHRKGIVVSPSVPTVPATTPVTTRHTTRHTSPTTPTDPRLPATPVHAKEIIFTSPDEGWVCADTLFHTADGGRTWQTIDYRAAPGTGRGEGHCAAAASNRAWVATQDGTTARVAVVQGGTDLGGGSATRLPPLPANAAIAQVTFADASHGWVAVPNGQGHGTLYRSTNGIGFSVVSRDAPTGPMQFSDATNGWAVEARKLERTTDGGATWNTVDVPMPPPTAPGFGVFLNRLAVRGSTIVVAGGRPGGMLYQPFFDVSVDGGRTWALRVGENMSFAGTLDTALAIVDADHWRIVSGDRLWLTDDGGRSWASRQLPKQPGPSPSLAFPTADVGWTIADDVVMQTTDAGRSWHDVDTRPQRPWQSGLAAVPDRCPSEPTTRVTDADPRAAAIAAARDFVRHTRGWLGAQVLEAAPAGALGSTEYAQILQVNVPKFCGRAVANATYSVTLGNDSITLDSSRFTVLAVGHFSGGWRVWGFYR